MVGGKCEGAPGFLLVCMFLFFKNLLSQYSSLLRLYYFYLFTYIPISALPLLPLPSIPPSSASHTLHFPVSLSLAYQVTAVLGVSSHTEARQGGPLKGRLWKLIPSYYCSSCLRQGYFRIERESFGCDVI